MSDNVFYQTMAHYKCLESVQKSSHELYLCYCGQEECSNTQSFGPSQRSEYLVHVVLSGKGYFTTETATYSLQKNSIFLICPGVTTSYKADKDDPWTYLWIAFNGLMAENVLCYAGLSKESPIGIIPDATPYQKDVHGILSSCQLTFTNELRRSQYLYSFVSQMTEDLHNTDHNKQELSYSYRIYVEHTLDFIENNYQHNIKISDIANYIGINRSYLTICFKKCMNMSPHEYLTDYRMNKAKGLITNTKHSIKDIAIQVGYEDSLAFSKAFKLFTSLSPKAYRAEHQQKTEPATPLGVV